MLADGTIVNAGGKVVKNVAGYDLGKLVCGSQGRLAFIGRVSLRLHPAPVATATVVVETTDAASVVAALLGSQLVPSAVDVLHPGRVAVLFEGGDAAVAAQVESTVGTRGRHGGRRLCLGRVARAPGGCARTCVVRARRARERSSRATVRPSFAPRRESHFFRRRRQDETPEAALALAERVRERFDPKGVLA